MSLTLGPEWHISKVGYDILNENSNLSNDQLLKLALDTDIKEICKPVLSSELTKEKTSKLVLQIQKIKNVSAPKANEESQAAPRLLKLSLTDGDTYVQALEVSPLNLISRNNTPPGTKLLINNAKVSLGYLLLTPSNCTLLGGKVPALIEKWELAKNIKNTQRNFNEDGPPPWINFGGKIQTTVESSNFKSLGGKAKEVNKGNSDFELQRQGAIAEATSGAIKKIFGGRVKQNIQTVRNTSKFERKDISKNKPKISSQRERDVDEKTEKPQEKVSLFSFLENKLPVNAYNIHNNDIALKESKNLSQARDNSDGYIQRNHNKPNKFQYPSEDQFSKMAKNLNSNDYVPRGFDKNVPKQYQNQRYIGYQRNKNSNTQNNTEINVIHNAIAEKPEPTYQKKVVNTDNQKNITQNSSPLVTNKVASQSHQKQKSIEEATHLMSKFSLNSQFASRSLRQHLNLGLPKQNLSHNANNVPNNTWNIGDSCFAKYWEDDKFYDAEILAVTDKTVVVKFSGYGNTEEVLSTDCLPARRNTRHNQLNGRNDQNSRPYSGSLEFRRSARNF